MGGVCLIIEVCTGFEHQFVAVDDLKVRIAHIDGEGVCVFQVLVGHIKIGHQGARGGIFIHGPDRDFGRLCGIIVEHHVTRGEIGVRDIDGHSFCVGRPHTICGGHHQVDCWLGLINEGIDLAVRHFVGQTPGRPAG